MTTCKEIVPQLYAPSRVQVRLQKPGQHNYFGEIRALGNGAMYQERQQAEFEETVFYVNHTHAPVTVQRRDGLALVIAHKPDPNQRGFSIFRHMKLRGEVLKRLLEDASDVRRVNTIELEEIRESLTRQSPTHLWGEVEILLEYFIPSEAIQENGGLLYHYQSDSVITWRNRNQIDDHPYSHEFANLGGFGREETYGEDAAFNLKIRYVNNSSRAQPLFMKVAGRVVKLYPEATAPAQMIVSRGKDGIRRSRPQPNYVQLIYSSRNDDNRPHSEMVASIKYDLEQVRDQLGIFENYQDAAKDDAIEWAHKAKVSEMGREIEELKATNTRSGLELEREKHEIAKERANMEREKQNRDQEHERMKAELAREAAEIKRQQTLQEHELAKTEYQRKQWESMSKQMADQTKQAKDAVEDLKAERDKEEQRWQRQQNDETKRFFEQQQARRDNTNHLFKLAGVVASTAVAVIGLLVKLKG